MPECDGPVKTSYQAYPLSSIKISPSRSFNAYLSLSGLVFATEIQPGLSNDSILNLQDREKEESCTSANGPQLGIAREYPTWLMCWCFRANVLPIPRELEPVNVDSVEGYVMRCVFTRDKERRSL